MNTFKKIKSIHFIIGFSIYFPEIPPFFKKKFIFGFFRWIEENKWFLGGKESSFDLKKLLLGWKNLRLFLSPDLKNIHPCIHLSIYLFIDLYMIVF